MAAVLGPIKNHVDVNRIISNNETGYLLDSYSKKDIIKGIEYLINEDSKTHRIRAKNAKKYAITFFDYKNKISSLAFFFESIKNL